MQVGWNVNIFMLEKADSSLRISVNLHTTDLEFLDLRDINQTNANFRHAKDRIVCVLEI